MHGFVDAHENINIGTFMMIANCFVKCDLNVFVSIKNYIKSTPEILQTPKWHGYLIILFYSKFQPARVINHRYHVNCI